MSDLRLTTECAGQAARLICSGRVVAGITCQELEAVLQQLRREVERVDLDLEQITFLDSSGIGVLVRNLVLSRKEGKTLQIAAMSARVRTTLEMTNVISQFKTKSTERSGGLVGLRILFAHPSAEVRTFVGALLKDRGAVAETCASLYDVKLLVGRDRVDLIVVPAEFDASSLPSSTPRVLQLKKGIFSDSGEQAAESLLQHINSVIAAE
jgi:anti-sigma B factor antagonist